MTTEHVVIIGEGDFIQIQTTHDNNDINANTATNNNGGNNNNNNNNNGTKQNKRK